MSNIDIVKVILSHIGDDPAQDRALAQGCIVILEGAEQTKPAQSKDKPKAEAKPKAAPKKRKPFDTGKMKALLDGGMACGKDSRRDGLFGGHHL